MFWIGLIVGIALAIGALLAIYALGLKCYVGCTHQEWMHACEVAASASQNRECDLVAVRDGETIDYYTFEEL